MKKKFVKAVSLVAALACLSSGEGGRSTSTKLNVQRSDEESIFK